jgi:hypothetical protein
MDRRNWQIVSRLEVFVDLLREAVVNDVLADAVVSLTDAVEMAALINGIGINVACW